ncbi:MAG: Gfo/Idh/MocA family oxidoreductase [Alphaproteobacteria bacterium]
MRFLIVGLGSMGKRRVRNLKRLGVTDITGFDPRADRRAEAAAAYGIETVGDWAAAEALAVDAWVISTPPDTHLDYGFKALDRGIAFFAEASVTDERAPEMIRRLKETGGVGCPSCTMRYYAGPRKIKELVASGVIGRPLMMTYHVGQWLPDWHPWESYKDFYVSKRATGACREIVPFELTWLVDILGDVDAVTCMRGKVSDLDCDIDDVYQLLLKFRSGLSGHLAVDVVARPAVRMFRLNGREGTIEWDHGQNVVRLWTATGEANKYDLQVFDLAAGTVEAGYIHAEEPYVDEMRDFVAAVRRERPWPYPFESDEHVLSLLVRAERSSDEGVRA